MLIFWLGWLKPGTALLTTGIWSRPVKRPYGDWALNQKNRCAEDSCYEGKKLTGGFKTYRYVRLERIHHRNCRGCSRSRMMADPESACYLVRRHRKVFQAGGMVGGSGINFAWFIV